MSRAAPIPINILLLASAVFASGLAPVAGDAGGAHSRGEATLTRPTLDVPLFAGPATLELSGRSGLYTWQEVHFGSDTARAILSPRAGSTACALYLAGKDWLPWAAAGSTDAVPAVSGLVSVGPGDVAIGQSIVGVDYGTVALRVLSTCPRWTVRFEPVADPELPYEISEAYYPVRGRTVGQLAEQADQAQDGWTAFTDWRTDWNYQWADAGTSCELTGGDVELRVGITYPRWRPPAGVAPSVVARWKGFMENLVTHELGHVTIALQGAAAIDDLFDSGSSEATCQELERATDTAAMQVHDRYERLNVRYDRVTEHGLAQGTRLP